MKQFAIKKLSLVVLLFAFTFLAVWCDLWAQNGVAQWQETTNPNLAANNGNTDTADADNDPVKNDPVDDEAVNDNEAENANNDAQPEDSANDKVVSVDFSNYGSMPWFEVETINGEVVTDQTLLDSWKPSMVYFTASRCPTCAKNRPSINALYPEYKDDVNFISISIDPTDTEEVISTLAQEEGLTYPMTPGYPQVMVDFWVKWQATTLWVDSQWEIIYKAWWKALSQNEYKELLDSLIANN